VKIEYGPDAKAELAELGAAIGWILDRELESLSDTRSKHDFRRLPIRHEPPWWRVDLNDAYAAVVRLFSESELEAKGVRGPRLLVSHVVPHDYVEGVVRWMIDKAEDIDAPEEEE
jgi:hypothetical protein